MTTAMNGLFAGNVQTSTNSGTLAGTQQLTNTASVITDTILEAINKDLDNYSVRLATSQSDMTELDKLISELYPLGDSDSDFLKTIDDATLEGMLKSQQSKRSRCKSKEMTLDNYKSMMTAAIAEKLLRQAMGKAQGQMGGRASGPLQYTEDRLVTLASDQDALRKEIRNVQSKKSILKSKAGFTESDERWQALLVAEQQLKSIRTDSPSTFVLPTKDTLREELKEFLAELDEQSMKAADLKETIAYIKRQVWSDETEEETVDEQSEEPTGDAQ